MYFDLFILNEFILFLIIYLYPSYLIFLLWFYFFSLNYLLFKWCSRTLSKHSFVITFFNPNLQNSTSILSSFAFINFYKAWGLHFLLVIAFRFLFNLLDLEAWKWGTNKGVSKDTWMKNFSHSISLFLFSLWFQKVFNK